MTTLPLSERTRPSICTGFFWPAWMPTFCFAMTLPPAATVTPPPRETMFTVRSCDCTRPPAPTAMLPDALRPTGPRWPSTVPLTVRLPPASRLTALRDVPPAQPPMCPPGATVMSPVVRMLMGTPLLTPRSVPPTVSDVSCMESVSGRPGPSKLMVVPEGMVAESARPFLMPGTMYPRAVPACPQLGGHFQWPPGLAVKSSASAATAKVSVNEATAMRPA